MITIRSGESDVGFMRIALIGSLFSVLIVGFFLSGPGRRDSAGAYSIPDTSMIGIFEGGSDIGQIQRKGSATFESASRSYTVSGSGENMWFSRDDFHFIWKKVSGDVSFAADVVFPEPGRNPHRKAVLMIRQTLDPDSAYVDAALHGDGLTSLQFRSNKGAATHEVQSNVSRPRRIRIEKRGKYARMYVSEGSSSPHFSGAAVRIDLSGPLFVGIGVCSHERDVSEKAVFSNVELSEYTSTPGRAAVQRPMLYSSLETQTIGSTDRRIVYTTQGRIEAPNWLADGQTLIFNAEGRIKRIPVTGGDPQTVDTGFAVKCNNDHGVSPDGKTLVISDQSQGRGQSLIYTLPITGGTPRLVTPFGPSYWHGWSPDGKTLSYCAERGGEYDVYTIPIEGGTEKRLTTARGLDDGPEYSPDGKYIYFNSDRTGRMQIWRMNVDGSDERQVTGDEYNNWFAHPSPDGRYLVFLTYEKDVTGHPADKDVMLRLMNLDTGKIDVLAELFGGQGTINVPCWSRDSRRVAFVTYQWIP